MRISNCLLELAIRQKLKKTPPAITSVKYYGRERETVNLLY